jgi:hypothetical protein
VDTLQKATENVVEATSFALRPFCAYWIRLYGGRGRWAGPRSCPNVPVMAVITKLDVSHVGPCSRRILIAFLYTSLDPEYKLVLVT